MNPSPSLTPQHHHLMSKRDVFRLKSAFPTWMARSKWKRGRAAPTLCADVRRFSQLYNADKVFGTHRSLGDAVSMMFGPVFRRRI